MTDKMDVSLDDIIKMNNSGRGGRGGRGRQNAPEWRDSGFGPIRGHRGGTRGNIRPSPYARPKELPEKSRQHDGTSLVISNLHFEVSDSDIKELFTEFGPLKQSAVHYDRSGRSLGKADVVFVRRSDALRSFEHYNNRLLDGRPMKIQLVTDFIPEIPEPRQIDRFANGDGVPRGNHSGPRKGDRFTMRGRGAPRGSRGRGDRVGKRKVTTVEDLDAELDAYLNEVKKVPTAEDGPATTTEETVIHVLEQQHDELDNDVTTEVGSEQILTEQSHNDSLNSPIKDMDAYCNKVNSD